MDSITQAALGAAVGGAVLGRRLGRKAVLIGALLGTLPDLDVVLDYGDAIANVTEHRGFSHSVFVLTGLATLLAVLCKRFAPAGDISLLRWWSFFTLCLVTHPLLDALTTYGTQLFWPLDTPPAAWPIIFIIDPVYTLALLIGLGVGLASQRVRKYCVWGLSASSLYLALAAGAKWNVEQRLAPALAEQGLTQMPLLVQPTPFNILLWRATIVGEDRYYESLVSVFDSPRLPQLEALWRNSGLEQDALSGPLGQRLTWFTGPFLRYDVRLVNGSQTLVATDIRLGFPGFHPFSFTLATLKDNHWVPVARSEAVEAPRGISLATLSRLAERATGDVTALCASDFVASHWRVERFVYRC
ncbi:metal-dependent hydrolase [Vreelandella populi]|uniref:Metal-dependent hydrolase n=1 Tax=Vreelandella populi TaxID=2498858 RepID=A0A433LDM5_9GAMM|nr:metal-dependent hydrolase [Halomonas populi]RUR39541.1 metal-dependent hydrolase [Halomonas populi]RUR46653.1 metal-dependent hydrolase [Halomonas populi]RUR52837.1 metal-dependent hydrolase [Halomonas populi]